MQILEILSTSVSAGKGSRLEMSPVTTSHIVVPFAVLVRSLNRLFGSAYANVCSAAEDTQLPAVLIHLTD